MDELYEGPWEKMSASHDMWSDFTLTEYDLQERNGVLQKIQSKAHYSEGLFSGSSDK